jgi:lipoprotein-anchoring transpeptidase ErfK/SrfK
VANGILSRRVFLVGVGLAALDGCASRSAPPPQVSAFPSVDPAYAAAYGPLVDDGHEIPGLDLSTIDPSLLRQQVAFAGPYRPGTIVVNVPERRLYFVEAGGRAMRYAVGVGRTEALNFRGSAIIGRKAEWPRWTPTATMVARMPEYAAYTGGMEGGIGNPLGARALYLYRDNRDTYFRLHGTTEPETIGTAVSSGCIRLFNHDIIDLYNRAPVGAPVVVLQDAAVADASDGAPSRYENPPLTDNPPPYDGLRDPGAGPAPEGY